MSTSIKKPKPKPVSDYGKIFTQGGILVPVLVGFALGTTLLNIAVGIIVGIACGIAYWLAFSDSFREKEKVKTKMKTPDDIVLNVLDNTNFVTAEPADLVKRPEAYSIDGLRWSHKLTFTDEFGEQDTYIIRGSLETGVGYLEFIEDESKHPTDYWLVQESNPE